MKSFNERIREVTTGGWVRAGIWCTLYIAFVIWVAWGDWKSLWWLLLLPLIADMFTTKYIPWSWWKKYKPEESKDDSRKSKAGNALLYTIFSWLDAIVFALVAVYFINIYIFQNYQIPSSSLEKTLRVGDFLYVSKMGYGAPYKCNCCDIRPLKETYDTDMKQVEEMFALGKEEWYA